jgi:hypothetical protein
LGEAELDDRATFLNSFFEHGTEPRGWKAPIRDEIERGNRGVLAMAEMAADIAHQGYLQPKRKLRNASTHRFIILHDISCATASEVNVIERYDAEDFRRHLTETLQLARAALIYFVDAIADQVITLDVPDHDWIRGRHR